MAAVSSRAKSAPKTVKVPTPFQFASAWYYKKDSKRVYLFTQTDDQKADFKKGIKGQLTLEQRAEFLRQIALVEAVSPSNPNRAEMRVDTLAQLYLDDRKTLVSAQKYQQYKTTLQNFCEFCGANSLTDLTPGLVRRWIAKNKTWKSSSTKRTNAKIVLQLLNHAVTEQILPASPLASLGKALNSECPEAKREFLIYDADVASLLAKSKPDFRPVITALIQTGRRPDEISHVRKSEVIQTAAGLMLRIKKHKNFSKTQKPETIYLTAEMQAVVKTALEDTSNKTPWLFVTAKGKPWNTASIATRWEAACKRAGISEDCTPYSARHSFITKALHNGVPLPVVAMLVGNSVAVLAKQYSHVEAQHIEVYFAAVQNAVVANSNYRSEAVASTAKSEAEAA